MIRRAAKILSLPGRYMKFASDWQAFQQAHSADESQRFAPIQWSERQPMLWEATESTSFDAHYLYHTAWAVRMVTRRAPAKHIDISSTLYFCATLSATVPVEFYDYRPVPLNLDGLTCGRADLTRLFFPDQSIDSLSCMHTIEHVGLGRYGDPIDSEGDLKAARELSRVVKKGGHLLMVVPVGHPRIVYNAHRIYGYRQILEMFPDFEVEETALIRDDRSFTTEPAPEEFDRQFYGCGCFVLRKVG